MALESVLKYIRMDRKKINYLKFILEGYDGMASLTTIDPVLGIVLLCIAPGCENDVDMVLQELQKDIVIEPVNNICNCSQVLGSTFRVKDKEG